MDSTKGKGNKYSTIPLVIRFTAGDEIIEDVTEDLRDTKSSSSLSSSPQNNNVYIHFSKYFTKLINIFRQADESSRRIVGDFLQSSSSFFNRKRSGSVEVSALSASPSNAGGLSLTVTNPAGSSNSSGTETSGKTWKLIKGKVSQAMEDIKLNKQSDARSIFSYYIFNYYKSNIIKLFKV